MTLRYRYSMWDGTQEVPALEANDILDNLTDDLMNFGDLQHALRNLLQRGMRSPQGDRMQGLRDLLQQLRQQRRQQLDRFDLSSVFDDLKRQLEEIVGMEQGTLDRRLDEANGQPGQQGEQGEQSQQSGQQPQGQQGSQQPQGQQGQQGQQPQGQQGQQQPGAQQQGGEQGGQQQGGQQQSGGETPSEFADMLRNIANKKKQFLEQLPEDVAGQVKELQNYEFMDHEAQEKFNELLESLKKAMMDTFFKDMYNQIANMSPEDLQRMKDMVQDLNKMLQDKMAGKEPNFDEFMKQYGDLFGDNPPQSLDELISQMQHQMGQMQSLLDSLPGDMRQQLQDLLGDKVGDAELQQSLSELGQNLEYLYPMRDLRNQYPFRGDEEIDLQSAMNLMDQMQSIDELERQLERTQYGGEVDDIDADKLEELLGPEARETLDQLKQFLEILEDAGYIRKKGNQYELTPRGTRKIGQRALVEIYNSLKADAFGKHEVRESGTGGERTDSTKKYEFGDPFFLDIQKTIMNSMYREGPGTPIKLKPDDFEVERTELITQTATVIMLDLSWSMALRGSFQAAKKVALALNNLISSQYQRDSLYIIGFSAYARELKAEELPYVRWDESVLGTNMHHALMIAQKLLAKHTQGTRQIIMISDGEPTAHLEKGRSYFAYPPSPVTIRETLKEVKRCTTKNITINTFMLDRNYYLKEFINQVARINKGRVFYTTPDKLGEYILVDYVAQKRKKLSGVG
ncbi:VWA domain-containing protein [Candidatus Amarobacter glycogenicus]|uniref:vWA domain-containing protein n=1 Tax=Candidatus Amarobacter glycogenicus TaxID=3140699 RepID=UPI002A0B9EEB|nr:VWA domain-containing protein [Dehalococcoidia bacterium]MBK9612774.1 VWA domain-containing protein [Dehalococcoidia bacterium]